MAKGLAAAAGKASLDMAMAALAAESVGFVTFAMPDALFSDLVAGSGLPALLPAAEPPLGMTARLAAVAVVAIGAFLLVWLALRALGQPAAPKAMKSISEPEAEAPTTGRRRSFVVQEEEAPRIRRADAHPDAPARRPLFAGSDLGEPLDEIEVAEAEEEWTDDYGAEAEAEPLPAFIADEPAGETPVYGEYGWEAPEEAAADAEPVEESAQDEEFTPPVFEPEPYQPAAFEPEPYEPDSYSVPEHAPPQHEERADLPAAESPLSFPEPDAPAEFVEPVSFAPPPPAAESRRHEDGEATIAELMQRLERGLQRRGEQVWDPTPPTPAQVEDASTAEDEQPSDIEPKAVDDRLRSALDDLQRMASRGGGQG